MKTILGVKNRLFCVTIFFILDSISESKIVLGFTEYEDDLSFVYLTHPCPREEGKEEGRNQSAETDPKFCFRESLRERYS